MMENTMLSAEVQAAAGELWGELMASDGDGEKALLLIAAAALKNPREYRDIAALALVFMATHTWGTALAMLAEHGIDADEVRQRMLVDLFAKAAENLRAV
ncbi:hypothetical protein P9209_22560 [Prescottella defluvii]|nr:hypothetical protein P9209_22560 [Prescottella defluvii]